ncbi:MAG TPA: type II secretion system F family protein [Mycobacteriales bacterium]|nr:type II secretion system F family protein [Mycobacteriales bacterium]
MTSAELLPPVAAGVAVWLLVAPAATSSRQSGQPLALPAVDAPVVLALAGAGAGLIVFGGVLGAGLGAALGAGVGRAVQHRRTHQAEAAVRGALPDVLRLLAAELQAGVAPDVALGSCSAGAPRALAMHLGSVSAGARLGLDPAVTLAPGPPGAEGLRALAACWRVSQSTGSSLGIGVARLASGLAAEERCRAEVDAQLAGPRASAAVLATLPLLAVTMSVGLGASPLTFFRTPVGTACLAVGAALDVAGLRWTRRLAAAATR